jgi:hypothetical protein
MKVKSCDGCSNFEYPGYERLDEGAGGAKRKRFVSILNRQAIRSVKEDQKAMKKQKTLSDPKDLAPKKQKLVRISLVGTKVQDVPDKTTCPSSPSSADVSEILKVMDEPIPFAMLSPLRLDLTSLLQSKETASATGGKARGQKKRQMMNVMQAIEQTSPRASVEKTIVSADAEDTIGAEVNEATPETDNLATTMSEIDRLIIDVVPKKDTAEATTDKGKGIEETSLEDKNFDLRHLGGQQLSEEDISELKEFAISCGYQSGSMLFGGVDEEILGCIHDRARAKIISTLSKSIGFPKLKKDISCYRRQHIIGSLFHSNFKVKFLCYLLFHHADLSISIMRF